MSAEPFQTPRALSTTVVDWLFIWLMSLLSSVTLLTHACQFFGLSFRALVFLCLGLGLAVSCAVFRCAVRRLKRLERRDARVLAGVLALGSCGACLALVSHRAGFDDYQYIPAALHHFEHPDEPLGFEIHYLDGDGEPFESYFFVTSIAYEYGRGVLAFLLHVEYLFSYYLITTALIGFLIPLALFAAIARFARGTTHAAAGALVCVLLLLLLGETHYTFGNFTFTRAFHGKTLLLAVGLPWFLAATIDFFRYRTLSRWLVLAMTATGFAGVTTSTIILLPGLAAPLALAAVVTATSRRKALLACVPYFGSLAYLVAYAVLMVILSPLKFTLGDFDYRALFFAHAGLFLNADAPVTPVAVVGALAAALALTRGAERRFLLVWVAAVLVLYLNPLAAAPLMVHVTTPYLFWRMFYLLPFPLAAGVATAAVSARLERRSPRTRLVTLGAVALALAACQLVPGSSSVFRSRTRIGWPGYKLRGDVYRSALEIVKVAPPGVMLAPPDIGEMIPIVKSGYPQVNNRDYTETWWASRKLYDEVRLRQEAAGYANGDRELLPAFAEILGRGRVRSVVIRRVLGDDRELRRLLRQAGYDHSRILDRYVVLWK